MNKVNNFFSVLALATLFYSCSNEPAEPALIYPETRQDSVSDTYFGTVVSDPYRWLEDDRSAETEAWVKAQNQVTHGYLNKIPFRTKIEQRLTEIWNYERYSAPRKEGDNFFFYKNDGLQNQSVLYIQKGLDAEPEVFLDPNTFSEDGTVSLAGFSVSGNSKYMAYATAASGSDWKIIKVMDIESKKLLNDSINWTKFSSMSWYKNGFFYSRFPEPKPGQEYSAVNEHNKVYYHKLGDKQSADKLIYEDPEHPLRYNSVYTTEDESFLVMTNSQGTGGNTLSVKKLTDAMDNPWVNLVSDFENEQYIVDNLGENLLVFTNIGAPNNRLVKVDPKNPEKENWVDIISESNDKVLSSATLAAGHLFASYMVDASDKAFVFDYDGNLKHELSLPTIGSISGFSGKKDDPEIFYSFTSYTYPTSVFRYEVESNTSTIHFMPKVAFSPDDFETSQVRYKSKDGTEIPMFLVHKKGLKKDGKNPVYLYGYGGFNISLTPYFSASKIVWLENGGVLALPSLRGGGEFGESWHKAGMLLNKQNVFDDFISAAEWLIAEKFTSSEKIAIAGGSNGGLLVGACMTQRPDLFAVALPAVGVMDMLRFHKFTVGFGWVDEYGSSDDSIHFNNLLGFSPLHNLKPETEYPATLVTTADHDDRVVPAHSFKFAAMLQACHKGSNPVLIRIATKAGHGAGKPVSMIIKEEADIWAFVCKNLGVKVE